MKKVYKALFMAVLASSCLSFGATVFAKQTMPEINWVNGSAVDCIQQEAHTRHAKLVDAAALQEIAQAVDTRMQRLQAAGKLPFSLKSASDSWEVFNNGASAEMELGQLALVPLVMDDHVFDSFHMIKGNRYHKAVITTTVDLAFAVADNFMAEDGTVRPELRVLHVIPLSGYSILGRDMRYKNCQISDAELRDEYVRITKKLILENLEFPQAKFINNLSHKAEMPTYQVNNVTIADAGNNIYIDTIPNFNATQTTVTEILGEGMAKALLANAFTSEYARLHPEHNIIPDVYSSQWINKAGEQVSANSASKLKLEVGKGDKPMNLTLQKTVLFEKPLDVTVFRRISCGARVQYDNAPAGAVSVVSVVDRDVLGEGNTNAIRFDWNDLLVELLMESGKNLAQQADGKKK